MISEEVTTLPACGETLDARVYVPTGARLGVVICHPHPLYGGDMDSPVVARMVEACGGRGLATIRFNFRGVGASTGRHEDGVGEQADVRAAHAHLAERLGKNDRVALAGYSFGAAMAATVAADLPVPGLVLVAPPVRAVRLGLPAHVNGPILVVVGAEDQYCPAGALEELRLGLPEANVVVIDGADHFFFGTLRAVGEAVEAWADALLATA